MRGKTFLKVISILFIVFSVMGFTLSMNCLLLFSMDSNSFGLIYLFVPWLVFYPLKLIVGIIGVIYCKKPEKAKLCLALGIGTLVLSIGVSILGFILLSLSPSVPDGDEPGAGLFSFVVLWIVIIIVAILLISEIILSILYIIGAALSLKDKGSAMKGKNYLKVTGILMIIFAGISIIFMLAASKITDMLGYNTTYIVSLVSTIVVELIVGILGVAYCKKPDKANLCLIGGIALLIMKAFYIILNLIRTNRMIDSMSISAGILSFVFSAILPVLYIIGAVLNSKDKG